MEIYVLVNVWYDHYRFQENIFASKSKEDCRKFAEKKHPGLSVLDYDSNDENAKSVLWNTEKEHLWIEKFKIK